MDYSIHLHVTPIDIIIQLQGGERSGDNRNEEMCRDWSQCWLLRLAVDRYEIQ